MQVIRDAPTNLPKSTLVPTGHSPGAMPHRQRKTQTPPVTQFWHRVGRASPQGHDSAHAPFLFSALAYLNHHNLHHYALEITMHAKVAPSPVEGL